MSAPTTTEQRLTTNGAEAAKAAGLDHLADLLATIAGAADYLGISPVVDQYLAELSARGLRVAQDLTRYEPKG